VLEEEVEEEEEAKEGRVLAPRCATEENEEIDKEEEDTGIEAESEEEGTEVEEEDAPEILTEG
jgi:hypothetical protein